MNEHVFWYVSRASGIVAWVLLTASLVWGLALSTRVTRKRPRPSWMLDVHRYLGGSAVLYLGLHIASLMADSYVRFTPRDIFVPMASTWRPGAMAYGIVAMYLVLAVEITSLVKRHIPQKVWRAIHISSLALLVTVWVHAFAAGTDMGVPAARWFSFGSAAIVLFLLVYRGLSRMRIKELVRSTASTSVLNPEELANVR